MADTAPSLDLIEAIARDALRKLPAAFRAHLGEVVLIVEEFADDETLDALEIEHPLDLTGLYHGRPIGEKDSGAIPEGPDRIHLYRRAILDEWCETGVGFDALVRHVLIHEVGHHFGLSDGDMQVLEAAGRMTLLALTGVAAARGGRLLFADFDLRLAAGGAAVVTGPNGAGKSTLLRIAGGLLAPAAGRVERSGTVAWLGEAAALDGERTLADALRLWARIDGADAAARVARGLDSFTLTALAQVPVRFLSTGQRRRAALARVVASGAALWLLDEPANGLDAASSAALEAAIAVHRAAGGAALIATHQALALPEAQQVVLA